jgi:hypothetical protein
LYSQIGNKASNMVYLFRCNHRVVHFDLFPSQRDKVNPAVVLLRQSVVLAKLRRTMLAIVSQHVRFFIAF